MLFKSIASTLAAVASLATAVSAINPISIKNRNFVDSVTGDPFILKGVDYQPGGSSGFGNGTDPLSDADVCARDIYLLQQLSINTLRIYSIDPTLNHDECMTLLASAGIYLVLDVNTSEEGQSLNRYEPWTTYTESYLSHVFQVIEAFAGYNNTLAFFAGNEVINDNQSAAASPNYVKAVVRDMKNYISNNIKRTIPVGYSAADVLDFRVPLAAWFECGPEDEAVDFYGVNSYQWCGITTFTGSGYNILVEDYANYSLPLFLSEYGCNLSPPRTFQEVEAIFSDKFSVVFSGGLVYEYSQESNNYGLVNISDDGTASIISDYTALSARYASATTSGLATPTSLPTRPTTCASSYEYLTDANLTLPDTQAASLIAHGLDSSYNRGRFVDITVTTTNYTILDISGTEVTSPKVNEVNTINSSAAASDDSTTSATATATGTDTSATASATSTSSSSDPSSTGSSSSAGQISAKSHSGVLFSLALLIGGLFAL
ncbi:Glucanosyltransferase-domain-containing protein [Dipodascopsis uninucleata]